MRMSPNAGAHRTTTNDMDTKTSKIETCFVCGGIVADRAAIRYCNHNDTVTIILHDGCAFEFAISISGMAKRGQEIAATN